MNNDQLILSELKNINTRLDKMDSRLVTLEKGQENLEKGQENLELGQTGIKSRLVNLEQGQAQLHTAVAQNTSMIEALKEAQESSTAAIRADIQDLGSKVWKKEREQDIRLDSLDEHTGHHNPIKH